MRIGIPRGLYYYHYKDLWLSFFKRLNIDVIVSEKTTKDILKKGIEPSISVKRSIKEHCEKNIASYSLPYEYEFRKTLPTTLVGKVAYRKLLEEEQEKNNSKNNEV